MKYLILALLLVTACTSPQISGISKHASTPAPDACADKLINGALHSTTVVRGAYACADEKEKAVMDSNNLKSDEDLAAINRAAGGLEIKVCGTFQSYDDKRYIKGYEVSSSIDGSYGEVIVLFNKSDGKVDEVNFKGQVHCAS